MVHKLHIPQIARKSTHNFDRDSNKQTAVETTLPHQMWHRQQIILQNKDMRTTTLNELQQIAGEYILNASRSMHLRGTTRTHTTVLRLYGFCPGQLG